MKCMICNSPVIESPITKEEIKVEYDIVPMNINALVYPDRIERYYDRRTMSIIEEVRHKMQRRKLKLDVVGNVYRAEAA